jgi:hypothetical protein
MDKTDLSAFLGGKNLEQSICEARHKIVNESALPVYLLDVNESFVGNRVFEDKGSVTELRLRLI